MARTSLFLFPCFFLFFEFGYTERITETWKNTTEGIDFKIKRSLFIKSCNKKFKITENVNIIKQSYQSTPTHCGKACQDIDTCLGFLFRRNVQSLTCFLVDHSVDSKNMEDDDSSDYYEIKSLCTENKEICNTGKCIPQFQNDSYTCECPTNYLGQHCEEIKLTSGHLHSIIPLWPRENFASISIKPLSGTRSWGSVFHFTINGGNGDYGDRCPMVLLNLDNLFFVTAWNGDDNGIVYSQESIPMNVYSHLYYEQRFNATTQKHVIKVFVNNTLVKEVDNNDARDFQNVKVYLSSFAYSIAHAIVKDFKYGIL